MEVRVYNADLYRLGQIENQTSVIWTRKFFEAGNFEIHAPITPENLQLFTAGNIVSLKGAKEAGVIEDIEKEESDIKNEITIKGRFLSSYCDRRIIKGTVNYNNAKIEEVMRELLDEKCEKIPRVKLGELHGFTPVISFQATYRKLQTVLTKIAKYGLIGYGFTPDFNRHEIIFNTMQGVDHSYSQNKNRRVIFTESYNNIRNAIHKFNNQALKTLAIVGGQGEGAERTVVTVGGGSGLNLREMFVDARDISPDGLTDEQYKAALRQRGEEALNEAITVESLESEVDPQTNFTYKTDYDLGDIVTVKKKSWGLYTDQRITEIQEVYEYGTGYIVPTLGDPLPETIDWGN
ncbi:MAG: siphovirus ReqiPepy6 Gp37-like family protein [Lachnospiraceae bacterium]|nr:siphovirus ReqiPepy6 Gp37-like family protein [Lachnospiraceae bacterium]